MSGHDQPLAVDALHDRHDVQDQESQADERRENRHEAAKERSEHEHHDLEGDPEHQFGNRQHQPVLGVPLHFPVFLLDHQRNQRQQPQVRQDRSSHCDCSREHRSRASHRPSAPPLTRVYRLFRALSRPCTGDNPSICVGLQPAGVRRQNTHSGAKLKFPAKHSGFSMSSTVSPDAVRSALTRVVDPDLRKDIVTLDFVKELSIDGGRVAFTIELATPVAPVQGADRAIRRARRCWRVAGRRIRWTSR